ncbi:MAG: type II toxin-antitoxin system VapC family toxin [Desulfovibrio sp.]|jgi:PIN domain nuclease of toxin-antitoxin system|nr:type II toxin-antitoxin system VapC family toxin [Desulfovibrio sp.]
MKLLLDTQMLLWAVFWPDLLPQKAWQAIADADNCLHFNSASLWEISIKSAQNRPDFQVSARIMRRQLLANGYEEIAITSLHTVAIGDLPLLHKDPFDRILIAQARTEDICLLTSDAKIAEYSAPIAFMPKGT